jgi:hypothetical protein
MDLGNGHNTIAFENSSLRTWSTTNVLAINGWNYNANPTLGSHLVVGVDNTGLTPAQLTQINFSDFHQGAQFAPTASGVFTAGEVVPVIGDINQDGHVDANDIRALEAALTDTGTAGSSDVNSYAHAHPLFNNGDINFMLDVNGNGVVNNADLQYLINGLKAGNVFLQVPEPASVVLGLLGMVSLAGVAIRRRRQASVA